MDRQNPKDQLARTLFGEARGEGVKGMVAVANVIMNRVADSRWPNTIQDVVHQPWQFSCWNKNDPNRMRITYVTEREPVFRLALDLADKAISNDLEDVTGNANHFHSRAVNPRWADRNKRTAQIGRHVFYKL